jgi:hypothetical protein
MKKKLGLINLSDKRAVKFQVKNEQFNALEKLASFLIRTTSIVALFDF